MNDQIETIAAMIENWMTSGKVGSIQVNFFKGGITTVNLNETKKLNDVQLPKGKDKT